MIHQTFPHYHWMQDKRHRNTNALQVNFPQLNYSTYLQLGEFEQKRLGSSHAQAHICEPFTYGTYYRKVTAWLFVSVIILFVCLFTGLVKAYTCGVIANVFMCAPVLLQLCVYLIFGISNLLLLLLFCLLLQA